MTKTSLSLGSWDKRRCSPYFTQWASLSLGKPGTKGGRNSLCVKLVCAFFARSAQHSVNKLKTTPTPNKNGSSGIKPGWSVCHVFGSLCRIFCRNSLISRGFYYSCTRGPPQFSKKRSENEGANENLSGGFAAIPGIAPRVAPRIVGFVLIKS